MSKIKSKEKYVKGIITKLKKLYPKPKTALKYKKIHELLFSVIMSAQSTDVQINKITNKLFKKYKTLEDYANADLKEFEEDIRSSGFYRNKAKNIVNAAKMIIDDFDGKVPDNMEDLIKLPGVARKTANIVLNDGYGIQSGIAVDTHVIRLTNRLGLTKHKDPVKIEKDLMEIVPKKDWDRFSHLLVLHGRAVCEARKPKCGECVLNKVCPNAFKFPHFK
ncbi:MAG TPA: endonuclease III [bacterium]|nr:endonuclease III [bacterium]